MYTDHSEQAHTPPTRNLSAAWSQVVAIVAAVDATLGKWLVDTYGIGLTEYRAVLHLSRTAERELRIHELAQKVSLNSSSVTRLVGRMEDKGLAFRDTCPDDGRGVYAVITEKGLKSVEEIRDPYDAKISELLCDAAKQYPQLDLAGLDHSFEAISKLTS
ncbi:MarR family transcriptional regulator [Auritidibacter ignavus]|uniref:MarR family winged helix-turn-helix transcriptional regulator n=1 Tax=Auritidibacter ignavus TaxID=678932 RepID=UPI000D72BF9A|nr:MarR family transcriptional regulator [Auritidibacter ignavus]AXR75163.1 MarR family transcriptional regulator [Auritidibacter sp. NML130574]PXA79517.1 MarR family transcriptional regulator [Auritidibacter sp. NML120779]PXA80735.1 MarR family transcriptional regulator [Auritidibacter sp. NML120636]RMX23453.1 MarR family transcriptional regulator [Auritidibacter ignavus]WHS29140.1 MarR family transcriptional regulator [Auritidibacter ignavus]